MTLSSGARLGPYVILSPLGVGGMGEVYRARDTRLGREVAIKVLPETASSDPERLKRFENEARSASSLNHPNIVTVHDIGQSDGIVYLAMELVDGHTLRELLARGELPLKRQLTIGSQVAEALARAHASGIVHRDLKPENVMITKDAHVKILDFGLAKLTGAEAAADRETLAPTISRGTEPGVVLGTVGYMSPEQALGNPVDFRSDQFSLGAILYEMATGKRAFSRASGPETLSAIIRDEPEPIASVNPVTPAPVRWIVERCLAKEPAERYASTVDLARDLASVRDHVSEISSRETALTPGTRPRKLPRLAWIAGAGALVIVGLAAVLLLRGPAPIQNRPSARLTMNFAAGESPVPVQSPIVAISPDGSKVVYVGRAPALRQQLYVRSLDRFEAAAIPGTEGGVCPFFSPDGQWVGFTAANRLKKVSLAGGQPLPLCDVAGFRGASWGEDGTILFSPTGSSPLFAVSDRGGEPKRVTSLDPKKNEFTHRWPQILPGAKAAIFTVHDMSGNYDTARIDLLLLGTGERRPLLEGATDARYVPTGHIVYLRAGAVFAVPFDLGVMKVTGPPVPVLDGVRVFPPAGFADYAVSPAGSLVYLPFDPTATEGELVWVDRKGVARPVTDDRKTYGEISLSPDGRRLAISAVTQQSSDIWVYDLARGAWDRLTAGGLNASPVWSHDGARLAFSSNRNGSVNVFWMPVDRSAPAEQLTKGPAWAYPLAVSPDGRTLMVQMQTSTSATSIWTLSLTEREHTMHSLIASTGAAVNADYSPDGRWIAYQSAESGRFEVYVTSFPGVAGRWQVSNGLAEAPVWSRDGREIYYFSGDTLMAVPVETRPAFRAGLPKALFNLPGWRSYDVTVDGQRFIVSRASTRETAPQSLAVVLGWSDDLKRRVAAGKK